MVRLVKKQKEKLGATVLNFQERITALDIEKDDLEQYWRRLYARIKDIQVDSDKRANNIYEKVDDLLKVTFPAVSHCVKGVQIWSFSWSVFSLNAGKYGPEKTPY